MTIKQPPLSFLTGCAWVLAVLSNVGVAMGSFVPFVLWLACQTIGMYWYGRRALWLYCSGFVAMIMPGTLIAHMIECFVAGKNLYSAVSGSGSPRSK